MITSADCYSFVLNLPWRYTHQQSSIATAWIHSRTIQFGQSLNRRQRRT